MKSVIYSLVAVAAMFSLGSTAPSADAIALAGGAPALCDLPGPPTASLVKGVSIASLIADSANNATLTKRASGTFQAFDGNSCDAGRGSQIGINGGVQCIKTQNRHSYAVLGCTASVTLFELEGCRGRYTTQRVGPGCYNVNTGYNWGSSSVNCV